MVAVRRRFRRVAVVAPLLLGRLALSEAGGKRCLGRVPAVGFADDRVEFISAAEGIPGLRASTAEVQGNGVLVSKLGSRTYFGTSCAGGGYSRREYAAVELLGRALQFTVDLSGAGCGCAVAVHLTSMRYNAKPGKCSGDHFCDAFEVCGAPCTEIDVMEANMHSFISSLHAYSDDWGADIGGISRGYGGAHYSARRDWTSTEYGPNGTCVNTHGPFNISVSFPTSEEGKLVAVQTTVSQHGQSCNLTSWVERYRVESPVDASERDGLDDVQAALGAGITPIISYWESTTLSWLDGTKADKDGPCTSKASQACPVFVQLTNFLIKDIDVAIQLKANETVHGSHGGNSSNHLGNRSGDEHGNQSSARKHPSQSETAGRHKEGQGGESGESYDTTSWVVKGLCPWPDPMPKRYTVSQRGFSFLDRYEAEVGGDAELGATARTYSLGGSDVNLRTPWGDQWGTARRKFFDRYLSFFDCMGDLVVKIEANWSWTGSPVSGIAWDRHGRGLGRILVSDSDATEVVVESEKGKHLARLVFERSWFATEVHVAPPEADSRRLNGADPHTAALPDLLASPLMLTLLAGARFGTILPPPEVVGVGLALLSALLACLVACAVKACRARRARESEALPPAMVLKSTPRSRSREIGHPSPRTESAYEKLMTSKGDCSWAPEACVPAMDGLKAQLMGSVCATAATKSYLPVPRNS